MKKKIITNVLIDMNINDKEKSSLLAIYKDTGIPLDRLPYTKELDMLHAKFVASTGRVLTIGNIYQILIQLRYDGELPPDFLLGRRHHQGLVGSNLAKE
jgi:hypothetical protein